MSSLDKDDTVMNYIVACEDKRQGFLHRIDVELPRRPNKDDVVETFKRNGLFRSYELRTKVSGRIIAPKNISEHIGQAESSPKKKSTPRNFAKSTPQRTK